MMGKQSENFNKRTSKPWESEIMQKPIFEICQKMHILENELPACLLLPYLVSDAMARDCFAAFVLLLYYLIRTEKAQPIFFMHERLSRMCFFSIDVDERLKVPKTILNPLLLCSMQRDYWLARLRTNRVQTNFLWCVRRVDIIIIWLPFVLIDVELSKKVSA